MLLACKSVAKNLESYLTELGMARSVWTPEYVSQLDAKIDDAIDNYLGLDRKKELREATALLASIQAPALRDLSFLKTQIAVDFEDKAYRILKSLGFTSQLSSVQKGDQEALIQLLYTYKKNMTEELRTSIVNNGTNPLLLERIMDYADKMKDANVSQETLKETAKALSAEAIVALNGIYDETIGICKIAANFYQYEPIKKEQFTFSKIVAQMGVSKKITEETEV